MIYLDNAATTMVTEEVFEKMKPYFISKYANPSSVYSFAADVKKDIDMARQSVAKLINADTDEIFFTAGGSESDNWALKMVARKYRDKGKHIITSKIEHHAVLHTCEYLEKKGFEISYIDVDENGVIKLDELKAAIRDDTILISVMAANNEIGTIQPLVKIGEIAKENRILFHTDAVQAFGHIPIDVEKMNIDLLSASAHKLHGPKGVGCLYVRKGVKIGPLIHGGAQERGKRAGTLNTAGIIGFGAAADIAAQDMKRNAEKQIALRDYLIDRVLAEIPYSRLNGHRTDRLVGNANFSFRFIEGESLLILLDQQGICASSGSACTSGSLDPSHVLLAIGLAHETAHGSLRLTLSEYTTKEEIDFTVEKLKKVVERLREMSPLYEDFIKEETKNVQ